MRKGILLLVALMFVATSALAAVAPGVVTQTAPIMSTMHSMQINETHRMMVNDPADFCSAIPEVKKGDEVQLKKMGADKFEVTHMPTGKTAIMAQPKK